MTTSEGNHELVDARFTDVEAIVRLVNSAYRGGSNQAGWRTEADLLGGVRTDAEAIEQILRQNHHHIFVARDGADLIACYELRRLPESAAYIGMIAIAPPRQGSGLGTRLLADAAARAQAMWGATSLQMTVIAQRTELIAWYEALGFRRTGQHEPFPYADPRFGLPKREDLYFVVLRKNLNGTSERTDGA